MGFIIHVRQTLSIRHKMWFGKSILSIWFRFHNTYPFCIIFIITICFIPRPACMSALGSGVISAHVSGCDTAKDLWLSLYNIFNYLLNSTWWAVNGHVWGERMKWRHSASELNVDDIVFLISYCRVNPVCFYSSEAHFFCSYKIQLIQGNIRNGYMPQTVLY